MLHIIHSIRYKINYLDNKFSKFCFLGDQLDEPSAIVDGYNSYFSFSQVRMGYSGKLSTSHL